MKFGGFSEGLDRRQKAEAALAWLTIFLVLLGMLALFTMEPRDKDALPIDLRYLDKPEEVLKWQKGTLRSQ